MMDIDGLGERYIDSLVEFELVRGVAGLYALDLDKLLDMKRRADERDNCAPDTVKAGKVATKWADNLLRRLPPAKRRRWRACCLPWASAMSANPPPKPWLIAWASWTGKPAAALAALPDIGAVVADSIAGFAEPGNQAEVDALLGRWGQPQQAAHPSTKLHGLFEPVTLLVKLAIPRLTELRAGQLLAQVADLYALAAWNRAPGDCAGFAGRGGQCPG